MRKNNAGFIQIILVLVVIGLIGGAYYFGKISNKSDVVIKTPSPTPVSTETSVKEETANWKTYTNTEYNYEIKYPQNWHVSDGLVDGIRISNKSISKIPTHLDNPEDGEIFINFQYFNSAFENGLGKTEFVSDNQITFVSDTKYISKSGDFGYKLEYRKNDPNLKSLFSVANQILSTFKFTK